MWEVDPETRSKLQQIQKKEGSGNDRCCDCGAPSPQWASPKFSTFICLSCAGVHRSLGVHISFVRSVSMDAFKQNEIFRMQHGGNKAWQDFYNSGLQQDEKRREDGEEEKEQEEMGKSFDESTITERYESDIGDEWKERLSAKVDDRPFDREAWKKEREIYKARVAAKANGNISINNNQSQTGALHLPSPSERSTPPLHHPPSTNQKERNEAYFSRLGATNASRPETLLPSQGGRYTGFGSDNNNNNNANANPLSNSNPDSPPLAETLTKSLGWFTNSLTRTAQTVNDTYIQPTAKNLAASDLAVQARSAALQAGNGIQQSARSAGEKFNRFVEGQDGGGGSGDGRWDSTTTTTRTRDVGGGGGGGQAAPVRPENQEFWDNFGGADGSSGGGSGGNSIGTTAMKKKAGM